MAMTIGRTAMTDDDGSQTIGTVFNNAWKTALYNEIDAMMASVPAFSAKYGTLIANQTGDGTAYTLVAETEIFDQGGCYNHATGIFTASITGRYLFTGTMYLYVLAAGTDGVMVELVTSNRTYVLWDNMLYFNGYAVFPWSSPLADLEAADTASVRLTVSNGAKDITVGVGTYVSGHLVS